MVFLIHLQVFGTATGKLTNTNSGLAVLGQPNAVVEGIQKGIEGQNALKSAVDTAVASAGTSGDVTQFANVAQNVAKDTFSDVAGALTSVPSWVVEILLRAIY